MAQEEDEDVRFDDEIASTLMSVFGPGGGAAAASPRQAAAVAASAVASPRQAAAARSAPLRQAGSVASRQAVAPAQHIIPRAGPQHQQVSHPHPIRSLILTSSSPHPRNPHLILASSCQQQLLPANYRPQYRNKYEHRAHEAPKYTPAPGPLRISD